MKNFCTKRQFACSGQIRIAVPAAALEQQVWAIAPDRGAIKLAFESGDVCFILDHYQDRLDFKVLFRGVVYMVPSWFINVFTMVLEEH